MKSKQNQGLLWLAESALMLAAATVLSEYVKISMPFGGNVTVFGMVPILLIAYRHGMKKGAITALCFGGIELLFGLGNFSYVKTVPAVLAVALLDYLLAFGAMALGGLFRNRFSREEGERRPQSMELALGALLAGLVRFICHFLSGATIWREYADAEVFVFFPPLERFVAGFTGNTMVLVYSFCYNLLYMLPETLLCMVALAFLGGVINLQNPQLRFSSRSAESLHN